MEKLMAETLKKTIMLTSNITLNSECDVSQAWEIHDVSIQRFNKIYKTKESGTNGGGGYYWTNNDNVYDLLDIKYKKLRMLYLNWKKKT
jgi:hypothetical protein